MIYSVSKISATVRQREEKRARSSGAAFSIS